jgi:hypothetical protein
MDAFGGCSCLRQLEIPPSVTTIEAGAFYRCLGLTRVLIPSSVMTLMDAAFDDCTGLKELQIPASISNLTDSDVFHGVKKIERLTLLDVVVELRLDRSGLSAADCEGDRSRSRRAEVRPLHDHRHLKEKVLKLCISVSLDLTTLLGFRVWDGWFARVVCSALRGIDSSRFRMEKTDWPWGYPDSPSRRGMIDKIEDNSTF